MNDELKAWITTEREKAYLDGIKAGQVIERERIRELLREYIAVGDPALISGVDRALEITEKGGLS